MKKLTVRMVLFCVSSVIFTACASPATREGMIPTTYVIAKKHAGSVHVVVKGGEITKVEGMGGKSEISNETLKESLVDAIVQSGTFTRTIDGKSADYLLTVTIFSSEQPAAGTNLTVSLEAGWSLERVDNGKKVWQDSIRSTHTESYFSAFAFVKRLRLATEGAVRDNIGQGLAKISALSL